MTSLPLPTLSTSSPGLLSPLVARFEAQALARPGATALSWDGRTCSYGELNARANQIAAALRELGVGPESIVGIHLDRTFDLIAGIFGILKAGGAYLPLDLACPEERLAFMLEDSGAKVLITESALRDRFADYDGTIVCLDRDAERLARQSPANAACPAQPHHLAYVIYTSGSTGKPKGCLVTLDNVARLFTATDAWFGFGPDDAWSLFHSSAFDFSVWEIFGPLLYGGRLVIVPYMVSRSASAFRELLVRERVTVLNQTPSAFRQLIQADLALPPADYALRYVIFGGEALEFQSLRPWFDRYGDTKPQLVNMYGITETTVHVTYRPVRAADLDADTGSNIGVPIPDLGVYVVDPQDLRRLPDGEAGEMLVGGLGVARGYLNRDELTRERFIANPFDPETFPRLYRSGDLARVRENGDLEYLGRIDHQVKIRGFRIELTEIESMLARHESVKDCAVIARSDDGEGVRLVAYLVASEPAPGIERLRTHLAQKLPDYMVPVAYVFLDRLPLTVNGKLDRAALPAPSSERPNLASKYVAPESDLETVLAELWKTALRQEKVSIDDNFFDLGADSLILTNVHRQLEARLSRDIPITDLFEFPTIRRLAERLGRTHEDTHLADATQSRAQQQRAALARQRRPAPTAR
ncbi:MAG: amino acid adenylation domain-containing protein [Verrucomicrobiota bacterium]